MTILYPGNLLIWLPGLLFLASLVYVAQVVKKSSVTRTVQLLPPGLFLVAVVVAYMVPQQEMAKAIQFANAHESHAGTPAIRYRDIDPSAMEAWVRTALPEEERGEVVATSSDIFTFEEPPASEGAAQEQPRQPAQVAMDETVGSDSAELVYQPDKSISWLMLVILLIMGSLFFLQDIKSFPWAR